jgi:hypothetical protein
VLVRKDQFLLRFLKLRVVVDGMAIYCLEKKMPVIIPVGQHRPLLVATDGYHHTSPYVLKNLKQQTYYFKVGCVIEDDQLIAGALVLALLYGIGLTADNGLMKALSFLPILYFLFLYYINRKQFLRFQPA